MSIGEAPAKIIVFGEHAVVYGIPAIALPIPNLRARAFIEPLEGDSEAVLVEVAGLDLSFWLDDADVSQSLVDTIRILLDRLGPSDHGIKIRIESTIPVASGMGSSAAISVAILRALAAHNYTTLSLTQQSELAFQTERIHHGTPSGIDNTVIVYERPVFFQREQDPVFIKIHPSLLFLVGSSGHPSSTAEAVAGVRKRWRQDQSRFDSYFAEIGQIVLRARVELEGGNAPAVGELMNRNQALLELLGVSTPGLESLIRAALASGAKGAKLSGGGLGGNVIALVDPTSQGDVEDAMMQAGATAIFPFQVEG
jgi:mevalonate kinase